MGFIYLVMVFVLAALTGVTLHDYLADRKAVDAVFLCLNAALTAVYLILYASKVLARNGDG